MPDNPFAIHDATIEWSHQLHDEERRQLAFSVFDDAESDRQFQIELAANRDIVTYRESLVPPQQPALVTAVIDDKLGRTARITRERARAAAKNRQPGHGLSDDEITKLEDGLPIHPDRGAHVTRGQRLALHTIKASNAKGVQLRQMPADD